MSAPTGYRSRGARVLRAVTRDIPPVWTPERGWADPPTFDDLAIGAVFRTSPGNHYEQKVGPRRSRLLALADGAPVAGMTYRHAPDLPGWGRPVIPGGADHWPEGAPS